MYTCPWVKEKVQKFCAPVEEGKSKVRKYGIDGEENATGGGGGGDPAHYLLILPVLVPVRPTQQRREISGNWSPQNGDEVHALEGVSQWGALQGADGQDGRCGWGGGCLGGGGRA